MLNKEEKKIMRANGLVRKPTGLARLTRGQNGES